MISPLQVWYHVVLLEPRSFEKTFIQETGGKNWTTAVGKYKERE